jgi:hypothetical protein
VLSCRCEEGEKERGEKESMGGKVGERDILVRRGVLDI